MLRKVHRRRVERGRKKSTGAEQFGFLQAQVTLKRNVNTEYHTGADCATVVDVRVTAGDIVCF